MTGRVTWEDTDPAPRETEPFLYHDAQACLTAERCSTRLRSGFGITLLQKKNRTDHSTATLRIDPVVVVRAGMENLVGPRGFLPLRPAAGLSLLEVCYVTQQVMHYDRSGAV